MNIEALRKQAGQEEVDYQFIKSQLRHLTKPRTKITKWLKSGELIRVKKGLYVFGKSIAQTPFSKEVLANLIYGPSTISLSYALSYYGLIPEKVTTVTSITNNRIKSFSTTLGEFRYYYLHSKKYAIGSLLHPINKRQTIIIASPEKALCDQIQLIDKDYQLDSSEDIEKYLINNLRIDEELLLSFKLDRLKEITEIYKNKKLKRLYQYIKSRKT